MAREVHRRPGRGVGRNRHLTHTFSRQLFLGETLDADRIDAGYANGVLTLRIPVAERAKPRRVEITSSDGVQKSIDARAEESVATGA